MNGDSVGTALKEYAKYPLSLTILGTVVIIGIGVYKDVDIIKIGESTFLLILIFVLSTIFNTYWFRVGRFENRP